MGKKRGKRKQRTNSAAATRIESVASPSDAGGSDSVDAGGDVGVTVDTHRDELASAHHAAPDMNSSDSPSATAESVEDTAPPASEVVTADTIPSRHSGAHLNDLGDAVDDDVGNVRGNDVGGSVGYIESGGAGACVGEVEGDFAPRVVAGQTVVETMVEATHDPSKQTALPDENLATPAIQGGGTDVPSVTEGCSAPLSRNEEREENEERIAEAAEPRVANLSAERERVGSPAAVWKAAAVAAARAARESAGAGGAVDDVSVCVDAWREASKVSVTMSHSTLSTPIPTPTPPHETDAIDSALALSQGAGPMSGRGDDGSRPTSQSARGGGAGKRSSVRHFSNNLFVLISAHVASMGLNNLILAYRRKSL